MKVGWKFWLFGISVVVGLEALQILWYLSQGYIWLGISGLTQYYAEVGLEYLMGNLLWYGLMVMFIAYVSAWVWQKIRKH